jgi:hypothetical protein
MRALQLFSLALLTTAVAKPDGVPDYDYAYTCVSQVEVCGAAYLNEPLNPAPTRTFVAANQPPGSWYYTSGFNTYAGPITWIQIASNTTGDALGYLPGSPDVNALLMSPNGQVYDFPLFTLAIQNDGLMSVGGIDCPCLNDANAVIDNNGAGDLVLLDEVTNPLLIQNYFNGVFTDYITSATLNVFDQELVYGGGGFGPGGVILSPFPVPEPSTLLLLASVAGIALLVRRRRASPRLALDLKTLLSTEEQVAHRLQIGHASIPPRFGPTYFREK